MLCGYRKVATRKGNLAQPTDAECLKIQVALCIRIFNHGGEMKLGPVVLPCGELNTCRAIRSMQKRACAAQSKELERFGGFVDEVSCKVIIPPVVCNNRLPDCEPEETLRVFPPVHLYDFLYDIRCFG
jgi:hypothetical protein